MVDVRMKYLSPLAEEAGCEIDPEGAYDMALITIFLAQGRKLLLWSDVEAQAYFNLLDGTNMVRGGWFHQIGDAEDRAQGPFLTDTRAMEHALGIDE